ncbi:MAG: hypothetical protein WBM54_10150 [Woeseia sp.]
MNSLKSAAAVLLFAFAAAPVMAGGYGKDHGDSDHDSDSADRGGNRSICERSAAQMARSCGFEINEEFYALTAKCINLGDSDERRECLATAKEERQENRELCGAQKAARIDVCDLLGEDRYDPEALLDASNFVPEPDGRNPFFSLAPGHTFVARAGDGFEETIVVTVTDEVREILGVNCRIVVDIVLVKEDDEYVAVEVTDDYYAQALNGDVHYCGEVARNFEDGALVDLDGSFEAGRDLAKSGILIKAMPNSGDAHRQEYLLGEAEDVIRYVNGSNNLTSVGDGEGGENPAFPCEDLCVKTEEYIPPEPEAGEYKYFKKDVGFVLGVALEDGEITGERDEVVCVGDSLDVLNTDACGLGDDYDAISEMLCELSPIAFCAD